MRLLPKSLSIQAPPFGTPFVSKIAQDLRWCSNNEVVPPLYFKDIYRIYMLSSKSSMSVLLGARTKETLTSLY